MYGLFVWNNGSAHENIQFRTSYTFKLAMLTATMLLDVYKINVYNIHRINVHMKCSLIKILITKVFMYESVAINTAIPIPGHLEICINTS